MTSLLFPGARILSATGAFILSGRNSRIRTCDLLVPNETRYQAALCSEVTAIYAHRFSQQIRGVPNRIQHSLHITNFFIPSQSRPVYLEKVVKVFLPLIRLGESDTHSRLCDRRVLTLSFVLLLRMYLINLAFGVGIPIGMHIRGGPEHASATRPLVDNYNPATLGCELMSIHPHVVKA